MAPVVLHQSHRGQRLTSPEPERCGGGSELAEPERDVAGEWVRCCRSRVSESVGAGAAIPVGAGAREYLVSTLATLTPGTRSWLPLATQLPRPDPGIIIIPGNGQEFKIFVSPWKMERHNDLHHAIIHLIIYHLTKF